MQKICDHNSVGIIARKNGKLLLIERARCPYGFAIPAGHVDGDPSFEIAAKRELKEEVGLDAEDLQLLFEGRMENPCRRQEGNWHYWKLYQAEINGVLDRSMEETKSVGWFDKDDIVRLGALTEKYVKGEISEDDWRASPGLEPVMYDMFKKIQLI